MDRVARPGARRVHRRGRVFAVTSAALGLVLLAACGGSGDSATPTSASASNSPSSPSPVSPEPTDSGIAPDASPLSGRAGGADRPILAVKIDNTRPAQPHAGLSAADLVYVEEVEWGLTRFLALFSTELPEVAGPVRSARVSDLDILAPFGAVAFAYSGAQSKLVPVIEASNLLDASAMKSYRGWFDDANRPSPVDHMLRPAEVLAAFGESARARDIGLEFSVEPPAGGDAVEQITAEWPSSTVGFRWDASTRDYVVLIDGVESRSTEGGPQRAATVVIQSVEQNDSEYGDKFGGVTPMIETVGSGTALVLRDGRMWTVTWERPTAEAGTRYLLPDGSPMPFAVGQQWIVLLDSDRSPILR